MNFYKAYHFLKRHPKGKFMDALDIEVVKVNPLTNEIDNDCSKNTQVQIWLETGPMVGTHDLLLDCGGNTFEEALIRLAKLVRLYYDKYNREECEYPITFITRL